MWQSTSFSDLITNLPATWAHASHSQEVTLCDEGHWRRHWVTQHGQCCPQVHTPTRVVSFLARDARRPRRRILRNPPFQRAPTQGAREGCNTNYVHVLCVFLLSASCPIQQPHLHGHGTRSHRLYHPRIFDRREGSVSTRFDLTDRWGKSSLACPCHCTVVVSVDEASEKLCAPTRWCIRSLRGIFQLVRSQLMKVTLSRKDHCEIVTHIASHSPALAFHASSRHCTEHKTETAVVSVARQTNHCDVTVSCLALCDESESRAVLLLPLKTLQLDCVGVCDCVVEEHTPKTFSVEQIYQYFSKQVLPPCTLTSTGVLIISV